MWRRMLGVFLFLAACGSSSAATHTEEPAPTEPAATTASEPETTDDAEPEPTDGAEPETAGEEGAPEVLSEIACESSDDCWVEDGRPIARPRARRGESFEPCSGGEESAPVCYEGRCGAGVLRLLIAGARRTGHAALGSADRAWLERWLATGELPIPATS